MIPSHIRSRIRQQFKRAAEPTLPLVAAVPAGLLVVAAAAGVAFSQTGGQQAPHRTSDMAMVRTGEVGGGQAARSTPRAAAPTASKTPAAPASKMLDFQFQLQPNYYYCGPAATRIALSGSGHVLSQDQIAGMLGTTTNGTNSAYDTTRVLNQVIGRNVYQTREIPAYPATPAQMDQLQADVVRAITGGRIIVANIAGYTTDEAGGFHDYSGGHYLTIVGYKDDGRTVKIADPADTNGDGTYWLSTIKMANWIAQRGYSY